MAVTITQTPTYPLPQKPVRLAATASIGNFVRMSITSAPAGSKWQAELDETNRSQIEKFADAKTEVFEFVPDKSGLYNFKAQDITRGGVTYGGSYQGDPSGNPTETLNAQTTVTVLVGEKLTMPIGVSPDVATLVVCVWDSTIRQTLFETHGLNSPAITEPKTALAKTASLDATVRAAVAALIDQTATTVLGTLSTIYDDLLVRYVTHLVQAGVHYNDDANNGISTSFLGPTTADGLIACAGELVTKLDRHIRNDRGIPGAAGTGSGDYHTKADWPDTLVARPPSTLAGALIAMADCWRAYEAHRLATVHASYDTFNTLAALPRLLNLHRLFLVVTQSANPTSPATVNPGATLLIHGAGMSES